jgi:cystathionine beta-lyase
MTNHEYDAFEIETQLIALGRHAARDQGSVNPPVHRTSTVLFKHYEEFEGYQKGEVAHRGYGRYGNPTSDSLEEAMTALEGADHALVFSSGLAAVTTSMLAFCGAGDHVLIPDSVYSSTRAFTTHELPRMGVEVEYYDPTIGAAIAEKLRKNTKFVYCESPGSLTFEMQDIPAIAKAAHAHGALVLADNTWATQLHQNPFALGIDISIHSATKYVAGHSDLVMGVVTCMKEHYKSLKRMHHNLGACASGDACYLALRGLRTMALRLKQHEINALTVAKWLQQQPAVKRVLFPALPTDPGHALWKRDMKGACGLFGVELGKVSSAQLSAMIDGLHHFGIGFSWGGYESLIIAYKPASMRSQTTWDKDSVVLRLHIGLEAPSDIIADLDAGFGRMAKVA